MHSSATFGGKVMPCRMCAMEGGDSQQHVLRCRDTQDFGGRHGGPSAAQRSRHCNSAQALGAGGSVARFGSMSSLRQAMRSKTTLRAVRGGARRAMQFAQPWSASAFPIWLLRSRRVAPATGVPLCRFPRTNTGWPHVPRATGLKLSAAVRTSMHDVRVYITDAQEPKVVADVPQAHRRLTKARYLMDEDIESHSGMIDRDLDWTVVVECLAFVRCTTERVPCIARVDGVIPTDAVATSHV